MTGSAYSPAPPGANVASLSPLALSASGGGGAIAADERDEYLAGELGNVQLGVSAQRRGPRHVSQHAEALPAMSGHNESG